MSASRPSATFTGSNPGRDRKPSRSKSSRICGRMAMFRNILVHIPSERPARPVIDVAVALTIARRSHLDAIAIGYESMSAAGMLVEGAGAGVAAVMGAEQERAQRSASAAIAVFETEAR